MRRRDSPPSGRISLATLESHLWGAADLLRGSIDSGDFKTWILGLLFYRRLCDVWDEESRGSEDGHRFAIPTGAHWKDIRTQREGLGAALGAAFAAIEAANPALGGTFREIDFTNQHRFPDALLKALLDHFEKHRMGHEEVPSTVLADAYEYLISRFADDAGKKGGEFYTPREIVRIMVEILSPEPGESIYDPTCGAGGMLLECAHFMERQGLAPDALALHGQEKNLTTSALAKMALFLHDIDGADIAQGDTLLNPRHRTPEGGLQQFDGVLANPPFSLKHWGFDMWSKGDPFGRDALGCPPRGFGDMAFIEHMLASLKPAGRMTVVVPLGVLFRASAEGRIRAGMLQADLVEAVVALGPNLFYGTTIPAAVIVIRKRRRPERAGSVLFVNASAALHEGRNQHRLGSEHVERIVAAVKGYADEPLFSRVVGHAEIAENDYNLNVSRYVATTPPPERIDVAVELKRLGELTRRRDRAEKLMASVLKEMDRG
jgi:type I restriction enzyme M protein